MIPGAELVEKTWIILDDATMPSDGRTTINTYLTKIEKSKQLDIKRPLTKGELKKLNDNFLLKLARFHIKFEDIHPFINGNG